MFNDSEMVDVLGQNTLHSYIILPPFDLCHWTESSKMVSPASGKRVGHLITHKKLKRHIFGIWRNPVSSYIWIPFTNCRTAISLFNLVHRFILVRIRILWLLRHVWSRSIWTRSPLSYIRCFDNGRLCRCCCRRTFGYFFVSIASPRGLKNGWITVVWCCLWRYVLRFHFNHLPSYTETYV